MRSEAVAATSWPQIQSMLSQRHCRRTGTIKGRELVPQTKRVLRRVLVGADGKHKTVKEAVALQKDSRRSAFVWCMPLSDDGSYRLIECKDAALRQSKIQAHVLERRNACFLGTTNCFDRVQHESSFPACTTPSTAFFDPIESELSLETIPTSLTDDMSTCSEDEAHV